MFYYNPNVNDFLHQTCSLHEAPYKVLLYKIPKVYIKKNNV